MVTMLDFISVVARLSADVLLRSAEMSSYSMARILK